MSHRKFNHFIMIQSFSMIHNNLLILYFIHISSFMLINQLFVLDMFSDLCLGVVPVHTSAYEAVINPRHVGNTVAMGCA